MHEKDKCIDGVSGEVVPEAVKLQLHLLQKRNSNNNSSAANPLKNCERAPLPVDDYLKEDECD